MYLLKVEGDLFLDALLVTWMPLFVLGDACYKMLEMDATFCDISASDPWKREYFYNSLQFYFLFLISFNEGEPSRQVHFVYLPLKGNTGPIHGSLN